MAKRIDQIIDEIIESSITPAHDIEITEHGFGIDIAQNGLVIHVDHSQFDELVAVIKGAM